MLISVAPFKFQTFTENFRKGVWFKDFTGDFEHLYNYYTLQKRFHGYNPILFLNCVGISTLDIAAEGGHQTMVKTLIETYGALQHLDDGKFYYR